MRPSTSVGTTVRKRYTSTAATTPALSPPKPTSAAVSPSSTTPRPPGVIGIDVRMRTSAHAANASTSETCDAGTSRARSETTRTANTVMLPRSETSVSAGHLRATKPATLARNRSKLAPDQATGPRRTLPSVQLEKRAATSPMSSASWPLTSTSTNPVTTTPRTATPTNATVASAAVCAPVIVSRNTATIGNERLRSWFQRLVSVTARTTSWLPKPQRRVMPYAVAAPTAAPPGTATESAVAACVSSTARTNPSPGNATCQGGAKAATLSAATPTSASSHGHESWRTASQTSP